MREDQQNMFNTI